MGPNGAGKTTTLRMLLGLARPDSGTATINGARYRDLPHPAQTVGAALENDCFHPGRSAIEHLRVAATAAGISRNRPEPVLGVVGLCEARHRRVGTFSLGMRLPVLLPVIGQPCHCVHPGQAYRGLVVTKLGSDRGEPLVEDPGPVMSGVRLGDLLPPVGHD